MTQAQTAAFLEALKRALKFKGVTYKDLAAKLDLSESSVKRIFTEGTLSLERVGSVLEELDMSFLDVAKLARPGHPEHGGTLTFDQESVLAADRKLFAFFHLIVFGQAVAEIVKTYDLSAAQCERYVELLTDLGLVERRRGGGVRSLVGRSVKWQDGGPLRKAYGEQIVAEFLRGSFREEHEVRRFVNRTLSPASRALVKRRVMQLFQEVEELAAVEEIGGKSAGEPTGLMVAFGAFSFSLVAAMRKKRPDK